MTSEAAVMTKPVSRTGPFTRPPRPTTTSRSSRSFTSIVRCQATVPGSMPSALPWWMWLSTIAAARLWAAATAWKSPVRCRFTTSAGTTWARPPPEAPPLSPKTGPSDGWRRVAMARVPMRRRASVRPMAVVVFPSPCGVGVMAVTTTSLPCGRRASRSCASGSTLATKGPWGSISEGRSPASSATAAMGQSLAECAVSSGDMAQAPLP
jgi:hypothetical protein